MSEKEAITETDEERELCLEIEERNSRRVKVFMVSRQTLLNIINGVAMTHDCITMPLFYGMLFILVAWIIIWIAS